MRKKMSFKGHRKMHNRYSKRHKAVNRPHMMARAGFRF